MEVNLANPSHKTSYTRSVCLVWIP